eukprot:1215984-Rhodomonas_salina.1
MEAWELDEEVLATWSSKVRWKGLEVVVVPVCLSMHWTVIVVDITNSSICRYDSLLGQSTEEMRKVGAWVNWRMRKEGLPGRAWEMQNMPVERQRVGSNDCAMTVMAVMYNARLGDLSVASLPRASRGDE